MKFSLPLFLLLGLHVDPVHGQDTKTGTRALASLDYSNNNHYPGSNTAMGYEAGNFASYGLCSSMVGHRTLDIATETKYDTVVGAFAAALARGTQNEGNTYVGFAAGAAITVGHHNSIVGSFSDAQPYHQSGWFDACDPGVGGDIPGDQAGAGPAFDKASVLGSKVFVNANNIVAVGAESKVMAENATAIGHQAEVSSAGVNSVAIGPGTKVTQANTISLGGDELDGTPMNVGIGKSSPNAHASLHLGATDKGLILNHVPVTTRNNLIPSLTNSDAGMLVYDLAEEVPYVWNSLQSKWSKVITEDTLPEVPTPQLQAPPPKTYTLLASADITGTAAGVLVSYGGAIGTGFLSSSEAKIVSLAVALDSSITSGGISFQVSIDGVPQVPELGIGSGRKGLLTLDTPFQVRESDLIEVIVTDHNSVGVSSASIVLKLEETPPTGFLDMMAIGATATCGAPGAPDGQCINNPHGLFDKIIAFQSWTHAVYWQSFTCDSQLTPYATIDLKQNYIVQEVKYWLYWGDARVFCGIRFQVSADGTSWTEVYDYGAAHVTPDPNGNKVSFAPTNARYVRMSIGKSNFYNHGHLLEIEVGVLQ